MAATDHLIAWLSVAVLSAFAAQFLLYFFFGLKRRDRIRPPATPAAGVAPAAVVRKEPALEPSFSFKFPSLAAIEEVEEDEQAPARIRKLQSMPEKNFEVHVGAPAVTRIRKLQSMPERDFAGVMEAPSAATMIWEALQYSVPEEAMEEAPATATATRIQKLQSMPEKDFAGVMEAPAAGTGIWEYEEDDFAGVGMETPTTARIRKLQSMPEKGFAGLMAEPPPPQTTTTTIRKLRSLTEKDLSGFIAAPRTMTISIEEAYAAPEHYSGEVTAAADREAENAELGYCEPVRKVKLRAAAGVSPAPDGSASGPRISSEGFSGFGSDSESTASDGYSVKDLTVDSDVDCFSSDEKSDHRENSEVAADDQEEEDEEDDDHEQYKEEEEEQYQEEEEDDEHEQYYGYETALVAIDQQLVRTSSYEDQIKSANKLLDEIWATVDFSAAAAVAAGADKEDEQRSSTRPFLMLKNEPSEYSDAEDQRAETSSFVTAPEPPATIQEAIQSDVEKLSSSGGGGGGDDPMESLWEHQDLIDQLRMEIKKARAVGLPTIMEESPESQKDIDELDLRPFKMDAAFLHDDPVDELHRFHKRYREKMRKFDMLIYQKNTTIGILRLEGKLQALGAKKPLLPAVMSFVMSFAAARRKKAAAPDDQPLQQLLKELRCDLETVYVGQTCLSWEFLRWQYEMARETPEYSGPAASRCSRYHAAAAEFQQFQVLVQRFAEDDAFHGPRLERYIQLRGDYHKILQVPVIKEDGATPMEEQPEVTSDELLDRMHSCVIAMAAFIRAEKVRTPAMLRGLRGTRKALEKPEQDGELFAHLQSAAQKKEKRIKDLQRSGNCLVKKMQRAREEMMANPEVFFSAVDVRLVRRVLAMPRVTSEQLHWCAEKLDKVKITAGFRLRREPAFLLFPC